MLLLLMLLLLSSREDLLLLLLELHLLLECSSIRWRSSHVMIMICD